jgi:hypothetical protein
MKFPFHFEDTVLDKVNEITQSSSNFFSDRGSPVQFQKKTHFSNLKYVNQGQIDLNLGHMALIEIRLKVFE